MISMHGIRLIPLFAMLIISGCAVIADKTRMEKFVNITDAYESVVNRSDFNAAQRFMDPSAINRKVDPKRQKNINVVDYEVKNLTVSEDRLEVNQDVEIEYYLIDRYILQTIRYNQLWKYQEDSKSWRIHTGLPIF